MLFLNIIKEIGLPAMMGQLAEECAELAHAALKYQRILDGNNPTPVTATQALANLKEEAQDVQNCLTVLRDYGIEVDDPDTVEGKILRWESRIWSKKQEDKKL